MSERLAITIDDERYRLRDAAELGADEVVRLATLLRKIGPLMSRGDDVSADEASTVRALLLEALPLVLDAPGDVLGRLNTLQLGVAFGKAAELLAPASLNLAFKASEITHGRRR